MDRIITTTTHQIEGKKVLSYYGIVTGEAIIGANLFKDLFASVTDIIGGRSGVYEKSLRQAKDIAIKEMQENAIKAGANAVIGVDLDYENMGRDGGMLMVTASGTAVKVE